MMQAAIERVEKRQGRRKALPDFRPGDQVKVHVRITEGGKERIQIFEGIVIQVRGKGAGASFTVRKVSFGVGVERIFPVRSPRVEKVEVIRRGKIRRAKIFYLRELAQKAARLKERRARGLLAVAASAPEVGASAPTLGASAPESEAG